MWRVFRYSDDGRVLTRTVQHQHERPAYAAAQTSFDLVVVQRKQLDGKVELRLSTEDERSASFAVESK